MLPRLVMSLIMQRGAFPFAFLNVVFSLLGASSLLGGFERQAKTRLPSRRMQKVSSTGDPLPMQQLHNSGPFHGIPETEPAPYWINTPRAIYPYLYEGYRQDENT